MGVTVGAALKKVLTAILTEPKALKRVLFALLVLVVAMIMPTMMVVMLFSGEFALDSAGVQNFVEANLSSADIQLLTGVEDTMEAIEAAMIEAKLGSEVKAAQVLYITALYGYTDQPGFASRLVSCFSEDQTDEQLIARVNAEFGTEITVQEFADIMQNIPTQQIDSSGDTEAATLTT